MRGHSRSPLAPAALLRAGTLCASPGVNDFKKAREWFAKTVAGHPGTREAEAAEFYAATLAWRGREWAEAERLHKAFAAAHPGSPLARVALEERLPAIAKQSLEVPRHDPADRVLEVHVKPGDRKRKAVPIVKTAACNAHLDILPEGGWEKSSIMRPGLSCQEPSVLLFFSFRQPGNKIFLLWQAAVLKE